MDRGEGGEESGRADDRNQHDVGVGKSCHFDEPFGAGVDFHAIGQKRAEGFFLRSIVNRHMTHAGFARLGGKFFDVVSRSEGNDLDALGHRAGNIQRRGADRAGGAEQCDASFAGWGHAPRRMNHFM